MSDISTIDNGSLFGVHRGKLNSNFENLNNDKLEATQVLTKTNTVSFTPTADYHPATKAYADNLRTSWDSVYDPNGENANMFDRANHTGLMPPSGLGQDLNNRLVSDLQISTWNGAEPAIGAKGTAFNKNFGTSSGVVSEGDHTHTKADLGLGNIDNTSDVVKPISELQQDALDLKLGTTHADFVPCITTPPTHKEGRMVYCSVTKTHVLFNDIENTALDVGREQRVRIINKTGATIQNLTVCKQGGVDAVSGLPTALPALADNLSNARVLGVITHAVEDGQEGELTTFGMVKGDMSGFNQSAPLYLSATTPGAMTETPPDLVSQVGGCVIDDVEGTLFVRVINHIALPTLIAILSDSPNTYSLTGTADSYQDIVNYQISDKLGIDLDASGGEFTLPADGWYRISINLTATISAASQNGDVINFRLRNTTQSINSAASTLILSSAQLKSSRSMSGVFEGSKDDVVVWQVGSSDNSDNLTFDSIVTDLTSVNIR